MHQLVQFVIVAFMYKVALAGMFFWMFCMQKFFYLFKVCQQLLSIWQNVFELHYWMLCMQFLVKLFYMCELLFSIKSLLFQMSCYMYGL
jgi:hypothetical protein